MRILSIVNQKGGCGKTTTALNLASRFAAEGRTTVLVDLDPQGHATLGLGVPPPAREASVAAILERSGLQEDARPIREILVETRERLYVAPAGAELAGLEVDLARDSGGEERLAEHLAPLAGWADRVVVDAPPSLGLLALNALLAAHDLVVPVDVGLFSLHGLARLLHVRELLEERTGHGTRLHVFLNAWDGRTRFAHETLEELRRSFPGDCLKTVVRASVRVREAAAHGLPVEAQAPHAPVVADYVSLAEEIERRRPPASAREERLPGLRVLPEGIYLHRHDVPPDQVRLAGDFNGWAPDGGVLLEMHGDGSWTKFLPLRPGRYEYKLVVGGKWMPDPLNPVRVANEIGSSNSVLEVASR